MNANQLLYLLQWVPVNERAMLARSLLADMHPDLVQAFDSLLPEQLARTVLFLAFTPHSREKRLASAARQSGWFPILICCSELKFEPARHFVYHKVVPDPATLILVSWLFTGPLVHVFVLVGNQADIFLRFKHHRLVLDIYDPTAGFRNALPDLHQLERHCIETADAITHRDLRIQYLHRLHGYKLPRHNLFIPDPVESFPAEAALAKRDPAAEIRVVSIGWVGQESNSILRVSEVLCANRVHVHVYFNQFQSPGDAETSDYYRLQQRSPYFHIEAPVYGDEYWRMLRRYDFGLALSDVLVFGEQSVRYTRESIEGCGSSRLADYITADLGVILAPSLRFQNFIARRYASIVVPADLALLRDPRPPLEAALARRAIQPRKDLDRATEDGVAFRLGRFYETIVAG